ncbi:hypothetical protein I6H07_22925 (plasmid) [Hafnia alvei]|nr:hypothetical protein [Hafnia alvei]
MAGEADKASALTTIYASKVQVVGAAVAKWGKLQRSVEVLPINSAMGRAD